MSNLAQRLELIRQWGKNSNSFITLYQGFEYFLGKIAYVDTPRVWVAATEPLGPDAEALSALAEFEKEARENEKHVFMLPVAENFARQAREHGYGTIMIGSEPLFEFDRYRPDLRNFHSAKALDSAGARVEMKAYHELSAAERLECEEILQEWLELRWMAPLSFLNRVNPWEQGEHKRFFLLKHDDRCLGFLAAVPVWADNGWYLIDLLRRKDAPAGVSELILMEAMRILKNEGAKWASLGLSPLSRLKDISWKDSPLLYRLLNLIFEHGNSFYRFKPLYEFKEKLNPSSYPRRYLIVPGGKLHLRDILSLLHAFVPGGVFEMAWSGIKKKMRLGRLLSAPTSMLRNDIVLRSMPGDTGGFVSRINISLFITFLSAILYPLTRHLVRTGFSFSWIVIQKAPLRTLFLSPLLHQNATHLWTNIALVLTFVLYFELLVGSTYTLITFISGALLANPLTFAILKAALPHADWLSLSDIGISLGVFSCMGALCRLFKPRAILMATCHIVTLVAAYSMRDWSQLNHLVALWIGFFAFKLQLRSNPLRKWRTMMTNRKAAVSFLTAFAFIAGFLAVKAHADEGVVILPESHHQLYQTYAFFTDEQTSLLYRTGGRGWGEVGGSIALLEMDQWAWKPQLVAHASANAAYRLKSDLTSLLTETFDARVGLFVEFEPSQGHRFSVGWTHYSGHVADDVLDRDLFGSNMGWEALRIRYFYTRPENFRYGGTLKPIIGSDPGAMAFAADQFFEWFPAGLSDSRRKGSFYVATGLEEYGGDKIRPTFQAQTGVLFGNHDRPKHEQSLRLAAGYYTGVDPRLKYAAFKFSTQQFGYAGVFLDL